MRILVLIALLLMLNGCSEAAPSPSPSADKYTQTWAADYESTSCAQFLDEMTPRERWTAAANLLSAVRNSGGITPALPADDMVDAFESAMENACKNDLAAVTHPTFINKVAVGVYLLQSETFGVAG